MKDKPNLVYNYTDSPIGLIAMAGPDPCVAFLKLRVESPLTAPGDLAPGFEDVLEYDADAFAGLRRELAEYFRGDLRRFRSPYRFLVGTPFQRDVWNQLAHIPFGRTTSYGRIAAAVGRPRAVRAVGGAVGSNPLPILLPCHRVVRSDGAIGGFGYGAGLKSQLLELENNAGKESAPR